MSGPLINVGDITKPATVLIEKVSDAVGGIAKPWQIKRTAKAEAEAKIILAKADMEISELQKRAVERLIREESAKQENIESITAKAIPNLSEDSKPENLEKDWLNHFFDRCRNTSDEEMQSLWANILAGQANAPGSFSKRSIELVSVLEKADAQMYTQFCRCCWMLGGVLTALVFDVKDEIYKELGISFSNLKHLDSLGLLSFESFSGFKRTGYNNKYVQAFYFGKPTIIELPDGTNELSTGKVMLTQAGRELAAICGAEPSGEFEFYTQKKWMDANLITSCIVTNTA